MARHLELVVKGSADYSLGVYDVGYPRGAEAKYALNVVEATHFSFGVASEFIGNSERVAESLTPVHAVRAYANHYGVKGRQLIVGFAETPDLDRSPVSESPNEEEYNDILSSMLREGESFTGAERDSEVRRLLAYL